MNKLPGNEMKYRVTIVWDDHKEEKYEIEDHELRETVSNLVDDLEVGNSLSFYVQALETA